LCSTEVLLNVKIFNGYSKRFICIVVIIWIVQGAISPETVHYTHGLWR
jgi:hypothetical protein